MTVGFGADLILIALIAISIGIYQYAKKADDLREYEDSFIEQHIDHKPYKLLKLELPASNRAYFLKMCGYVTKWSVLDKHPPQLENHFLGFTEAVSHPYFVQMIRCTKSVAIIDAKSYYHCVYVLKKGKDDKDIDDTIFNIRERLCYYDEPGDPNLKEIEGSLDFQEKLQLLSEAERDHHTSTQPLDGPMIAFSERHQMNAIPHESRHQHEHLKPAISVPEIERNEYLHPENHFDRSKSVRRWSSAEKDIYHENQLRQRPSAEEDEEIHANGYRANIQERLYPPQPHYNKHQADMTNYSAGAIGLQGPPPVLDRRN